METVFSQIPVIIPAIFVSVCAVLVFVFGFKKPNPLPEFDKKLNLSETTKRVKKDKNTANGDVKKSKKAAPVPEKKKEQPKQQQQQQDDKKKAKKTETVNPKQAAKAKKAEETAARKQEIREFRELEQEGGDWNVVKPKKTKNKSDEPASGTPTAPQQNNTAANNIATNNKPANKKEKKESDDNNTKEIKDRVNNELKNEDTIKAAISEIKEEITQPQNMKKKRARHE